MTKVEKILITSFLVLLQSGESDGLEYIMIDVMIAAKYLAYNYRQQYGCKMSEMQLHKLLYFAQRESFIMYNHKLFEAVFQGWKFGPVIPKIRDSYIDIIETDHVIYVNDEDKKVLDEALKRYGGKNAWSLSRLSHGECSWLKSRIGVSEFQNSHNDMNIDDIKKDAMFARKRREILKKLVLAGQ